MVLRCQLELNHENYEQGGGKGVGRETYEKNSQDFQSIFFFYICSDVYFPLMLNKVYFI